MGAKKQTIGYHYLFSILFGLCRGPIDSLVEIRVGDKTAYTGPLCSDGVQPINKPELFGGEKKEGGIQGGFYLNMGEDTQVLPGAGSVAVGLSGPVQVATVPDLKATIGGLVSEMRGVVTLFYDGLISSMNPYPKPWSFRVRRQASGWMDDNPWYPDKAAIYLAEGKIHAMNPAHIIYEALTNSEWGGAHDPAVWIEEGTFISAANTLCSEGFGLCLPFIRQDDIDVFIQVVLDHIGGALYNDRETGKFNLRLIRNDYDPETLPIFGPESGLLSIVEDDTAASDTAISEVLVNGFDPITKTKFGQRANNPAAWVSNQNAIPQERDYPGLPTPDLAIRVAAREMKVHSSGLKRYKATFDQRAWRIAPGSVIKLNYPKRGIANVIVRVGEITEGGENSNGHITMKVMEDVFGMPATAYRTPVVSSWTPPAEEAVPAASTKLVEANYRDIYLNIGPADAEAMDATDAAIGQMAVAPNSSSYEYDLESYATGEDPEVRASGAFTGTATLASAITHYQTEVTFENIDGITTDQIDEALMIGDEMVSLDAFNPVTGIATITRGVVDTLPQLHAAGARVWSIDDDLVSDERIYISGETVTTRVLTRTTSDRLDRAEATPENLVLRGRPFLPYPPAEMKVDAVLIYSATGDHAEPVLTWTERNRITQQDQLIGHSGVGTYAPEAGTTYNIRIYSVPEDVLLRTETGIVGTTYTYLAADQVTDGAGPWVRFEIEAERDGQVSYNKYSASISIESGYGTAYGLSYGNS